MEQHTGSAALVGGVLCSAVHYRNINTRSVQYTTVEYRVRSIGAQGLQGHISSNTQHSVLIIQH